MMIISLAIIFSFKIVWTFLIRFLFLYLNSHQKHLLKKILTKTTFGVSLTLSILY